MTVSSVLSFFELHKLSLIFSAGLLDAMCKSSTQSTWRSFDSPQKKSPDIFATNVEFQSLILPMEEMWGAQ